jgi:hypothetical protein
MERNKVFISYPSNDAIIGQCVSAAISRMPNNRLESFLDRIHIKGGARIPDVIRDALRETVYFVAIGTDVVRRNFDWCGQELGFYQASHLDDDRLETCLYDKTIPELFVERKSYKAQSLREEHLDELGFPITKAAESELYNFLVEMADLNAKLHPPPSQEEYWKEVPIWAEKYAYEIADSFFLALESRVRDEWYPQGRVELSISRGEFYKDVIPSVPLDTQVSMANSAYKLFKAAAPSIPRTFSWDAFTKYIQEKTGSDQLIRIVSDVIINALPDKDEAKNDYVFQAPNAKFYRVILVKHSVYGNKKRDFVVNLIETLEKVKAGDTDTTTLIAGIVLGSKYRSIFLEEDAKYNEPKLKNLGIDNLVDELTQMLRDIDRISADAASDGLADYDALQALLGNTMQVKKLFGKWFEVFPPMEAAAKKFITEPTSPHRDAFFAVYTPFLTVSRDNNTTFLQLCMDEYRKRLQ